MVGGRHGSTVVGCTQVAAKVSHGGRQDPGVVCEQQAMSAHIVIVPSCGQLTSGQR